MIIYNHKKEFIGIDEKDLKALKLKNLQELRSEAADFADLFVKTPGHIHNFQHVHWLDFVSSADSLDENAVILSVKEKTYRAVINLKHIYLIDSPSKPGYLIELNGLRELTRGELEKISADLSLRTTPKPSVDETQKVIIEEAPKEVLTKEENEIIKDPYAIDSKQEETEEDIAIDFDEDLFEKPKEKTQEEDIISSVSEEKVSKITPIKKQSSKNIVEIEEDDKFKDYVYDPMVASNELGLPLDLVEEFIQDFITQAYEFQPDIYQALDNGNLDNVKTLSHKLKGVAANLRIEDAFDALVTANTSDDINIIKKSLDKFYNYILKKLSGEEVEVVSVSSEDTTKQEEEKISDEIIIPKDEDEIQIKESEPKENEETKQDEDDDVITIDGFEDIYEQEYEHEKSFLEDKNKEKEITLEDEISPVIEEKDSSIKEGLPTIEEENETQDAPKEEEIVLDEDFLPNLEEKEDNEDKIIISNNEIISNEEKEETIDNSLQEVETLKLDTYRLALTLGMQEEEYKELLNDYKNDSLIGLDELKNAILKDDAENAKSSILRLKGMSDNMGIEPLSSIYKELLDADKEKKLSLLEKALQKIQSL